MAVIQRFRNYASEVSERVTNYFSSKLASCIRKTKTYKTDISTLQDSISRLETERDALRTSATDYASQLADTQNKFTAERDRASQLEISASGYRAQRDRAIVLSKSASERARQLRQDVLYERRGREKAIGEAEAEFAEKYALERAKREKEYARWEAEMKLQVEQRGIAHLRERLRDFEQRGLEHLFRIFESSPLLNHVAGVALDREFRPVYATPYFREIANITDGDLASLEIPRMLSRLDRDSKRKTIDYLRKRATNPEPFEITVKDESEVEHHLRLMPKVFTDRNRQLVSTFIQFDDMEPGWMEKMARILPARKKGRNLLAQVLDCYANFLGARDLPQTA